MTTPRTPDILASLGQGGDDVTLAMGPQVMGLSIAAIRLDGGTQPRAGIDQAVVEDYANDMEANGAEFPPVQVVYDGADYWLWDGFHRLHARKRNSLYTVPAIVRQGTRRDAVLLSVGANATHGSRRTSEDKRRAVETLLRDPEWSQWSDREIARRAAVDHKTVSARRSALSGEIPQIETRRVERNGTEYTMVPPQRSTAPAVASQEGKNATPDDLHAAVRSWLVAYDTLEEREAALAEVCEMGEGCVTFDDLREWIGSVRPRRAADLIQAAGRVLEEVRWEMSSIVVAEEEPPAGRPSVPVVKPAPEPWIVEELVEELVAMESVALDGVDQDWLYEYVQGIAIRQNRTFGRRDFDFAMRIAIPRQRADNERKERLARAQAAAMAADAERAVVNAAQAIEAGVKIINWRAMRGTITEDGRILVQMSNGTKTPPWLELDDAGQHWILDMIGRAQEVRA
jgi:hypothetical protein